MDQCQPLSLSHVEFPHKEDSEKGKIYLYQKPSPQQNQEEGSKIGRPKKLDKIGTLKHNLSVEQKVKNKSTLESLNCNLAKPAPDKTNKKEIKGVG